MKRSPRITLFPPNPNAESTFHAPRPERHSSRMLVSSDITQSNLPSPKPMPPVIDVKAAQAPVRTPVEKLNQRRIHEKPTKHEQDQQRPPNRQPSGDPSISSSNAVKTQPNRAQVPRSEQKMLVRSKSVQDLRLSAGGGVSEIGGGVNIDKGSIEQVRRDAGWDE